jgi:multiple sugar transport system substrate-binding protein
MKNAKKSIALLAVAAFLTAGLLGGCATATQEPTTKPADAPSETATEPAQATPNPDLITVDFWYLWSNATETQFIESLVTEFNASQDKYQVIGLSHPDVQSMLVAISGGNGPDVTDNFSSNIASYAEQGILEPLDAYISASNYDTSDIIGAALDCCKYKGKTYALPMTASTMLMFYNKTLFAEAGIKDPPKTDTELLQAAIALTKVNNDGSIDTLGYPYYPVVYFLNNMTYSFGGSLMDADGKFTPDNSGSRLALDNITQYMQKFGPDKVAAFSSSARYCDPADPFIMGKQAIRIDGPWFGNTIKNVIKADIDYGVAPLPYPDGHPELAGTGLLDSSVFFIPSTSKQKDGAWAFLSWIIDGPQMIKFCASMANLPSRTSVMSASQIASGVDAADFMAQLQSPNMKILPMSPLYSEFSTNFNTVVEQIMNLQVSLDDGMKTATDQANALK